MSNTRIATADGPLDHLTSASWVKPTSVPGLIGCTPKFEGILSTLQTVLTAVNPHGMAGPFHCAPVVPLETIDRAQYADAFPQLLGSVHALDTQKADQLASDRHQRATDVVLAPAVCYSVYPEIADRRLEQEQHFDVFGYCYRHEASAEYGRFRAFRMREFILVGGQTSTWEWRDNWFDPCDQLFRSLGLKFTVVAASDPFFGPGDQFLRASQLEQNLKYEFIAPVHPEDEGTAVASANYHRGHLGERFAIQFADNGVAHSACIAFGLERLVSALIHVHGDDLANWPELDGHGAAAVDGRMG